MGDDERVHRMDVEVKKWGCREIVEREFGRSVASGRGLGIGQCLVLLVMTIPKSTSSLEQTMSYLYLYAYLVSNQQTPDQCHRFRVEEPV